MRECDNPIGPSVPQFRRRLCALARLAAKRNADSDYTATCAAGCRGAPGRLRPEVGSRGFLKSLGGGNHHRGSVHALDVLDLLGDTPGVIDSILGKHGAGQHDDTMRRGHTDVDVLADAVGS